MKKLIAILAVMIVLVGAVFAASGDKLSLKSIVGEVLPVYEIHSQNASGTVGTQNGAEVATGMDLSTQNISWTFVIIQKGEVDGQQNAVTFAKTKQTATLTITLGHFVGDEEHQQANDSPKFTAFTAATPNQTNDALDADKKTVITVPTGDALNASSANVTAAYKGVNWADQEIATFTALWTKDDTLKMDTYHADVTLTYTPE